MKYGWLVRQEWVLGGFYVELHVKIDKKRKKTKIETLHSFSNGVTLALVAHLCGCTLRTGTKDTKKTTQASTWKNEQQEVKIYMSINFGMLHWY